MSRLQKTLVGASYAFLLLSGGAALVVPRLWAQLFSFGTSDAFALAFARVAGAREVVLVLIAIVLARRGLVEAAPVIIGLSMLIGVADIAIVFAVHGTPPLFNLVLHSIGLIVLGATSLALRR